VVEILQIPKKKSRQFKFVLVETPVGEIEIREHHGFQPIDIKQAKRFTGMSSDFIRGLMKKGKLTRLNPNGTIRKGNARGTKIPLCFCFKQYNNLQLA
jgi:hypothetical protein